MLSSSKNVEDLFVKHYESFPDKKIFTLNNTFLLEVLSFGLWRRQLLLNRLQESMQYQLHWMQQLRAFVQHSPENRKALRDFVFVLKLATISASSWQHSFVAKAASFTVIAKAVLDE